MQRRYLIDQIGRDEATHHAEDGAADGGKAQHRGVEHDGTPGEHDGEHHDPFAHQSLVDAVVRQHPAQQVHCQPLTGFTKAQIDAEVGSHYRKDVEGQAQELEGLAGHPLRHHRQCRDVFLGGFDRLIVTHGQGEGDRVEEHHHKQDAEGDIHGAHRLEAGHFQRFLPRTVGDHHGAQALDKEDGGEGEGEHDDGILHPVTGGGHGGDVGRIPLVHHHQAEHGHHADLGQHHKGGDLEQQVFAARGQRHQTANQHQTVEGIFREQVLGDAEALQEGGAVVGNGGGVDEDPDHQHHEVEGAEQHTPVLAKVAGDDAGVILAFG